VKGSKVEGLCKTATLLKVEHAFGNDDGTQRWKVERCNRKQEQVNGDTEVAAVDEKRRQRRDDIDRDHTGNNTIQLRHTMASRHADDAAAPLNDMKRDTLLNRQFPLHPT
jgi:hypothetical protein